jgi:hypothetical protein
MTYYVGLDLGQSADYTALAVVQKVEYYDWENQKHERDLHLRHLERFPLKTPYTDIADHVKELVSSPSLRAPVRYYNQMKTPEVQLIVDETGVGVAVTDLLKERGLKFFGVTITGLGQKVNTIGTRRYTVPKQDLVAALEVPFHKGSLKVAEGLYLWGTLRDELLNFRRKQNPKTGYNSYEHWRESDHDDLVLAAALACWKATRRRAGTTTLTVIR